MEKAIVIDAFHRGLLSKDECTKLLGIDPNILIDEELDLEKVFVIENFSRNNKKGLQ